MDEQKERENRDIQEARYFSSIMLTLLDKFYPGEIILQLSPKAFMEKVYFRKKVLECANNIGRYIDEAKNKKNIV